jgi:hypothetical protein
MFETSRSRKRPALRPSFPCHLPAMRPASP